MPFRERQMFWSDRETQKMTAVPKSPNGFYGNGKNTHGFCLYAFSGMFKALPEERHLFLNRLPEDSANETEVNRIKLILLST